MSEPTYAELLERIEALLVVVAEQAATIVELELKVAVLERRLGSDSSNSSRPPSSDAPWDKPAKPRSGRGRSGLRPGKQPGDRGMSRSLSGSPDRVVLIEPPTCCGCGSGLTGCTVTGVERRQVVDLAPVPPPVIIEYQRISQRCRRCGAATAASWSGAGDGHAEVLAGPGSPVRIGPAALGACAFLTCAQYLPVARATALLHALTGLRLATGFVAGVRGRAARKLTDTFLPYVKNLLTGAGVLHADETTARAQGALAYVHVACTDYLTVMHVGGRSAADIDAGGVLPAFTGVLVRDGYAGYDHLPAVHAWCAAHLLRDLRSVSDADPQGQLWAIAMADTLLSAHHAAGRARGAGRDRLDPDILSELLNHYKGALAKGRLDNTDGRSDLADRARTLIRRFSRYQDMILRFATDLTVPFTNNQAERSIRPVKVQQRSSGGAWRTLTGLADFAVIHSYLDTAAKWGKDRYQALTELFTTGPWLPPALTPAE